MTGRRSTLVTWTRFAQAHEEAGFDRVLIGYGATGPDGFAVAAHVLYATSALKVLIAHRPGFAAPTLVARKLATLDQLTGGGRVAIHHITGGDEPDQKRDGDFTGHDRRYARTAEFMSLLRRELTSADPFDYDGEFYQVRGAYSSVRPPTATGIPLYFGGASAPAVDVGAEHADVYMLWGEPVAQIAERITRIQAAAARHGRSVRFSLSVRPIVADTEEAAWQRAEDIRSATAGRVQTKTAQVQGIQVPSHGRSSGFRESSSVGSERLQRQGAERDVHDERLWYGVTKLTGPGGNSTRAGRHPAAGHRRPDGLPPGGRGHRAHPRLRPAGRRGGLGQGPGAAAARAGGAHTGRRGHGRGGATLGINHPPELPGRCRGAHVSARSD